jgi:transcription elongation factor Elf1
MGLYDFIEGGYIIMQEYANEAFEAAMDFLEQLGLAAGNIDIPSVSLTWKPLPDIPGMKVAKPPSEVSIVPDFPTAPSDYVPGVITPPAVEEAPEFNVQDPNVLYPNKPSPDDPGDVPSAPATDTDFLYPDAPDTELPATPILRDIVLPTLAPISYPEFTGTMPTDDLSAPSLSFQFTEEEYDSALLDAITVELIDRVTNGGTGLNPLVEQAIWDRGRDREDQLALKAAEGVRDDFAKRGHTLPPGAEYKELANIQLETLDKLATYNREVTIKQAELEQANIQHAITETIKLESVLVRNWNDIMQRKFAVAQYTQEAAINIFNAQVSLYNTRVQGYNIQATVFNILVQSEIAKIEAYKAELDGARLISEINKIDVDIYSELINALNTQVNLYTAELEGVKTKLEAEKTKIDIYLGEMQGYTAKIAAISEEYKAYKIEVDAETSKVDLYSSQVDAYSSRIQAYTSEVNATKAISDVQIDQERLRLDSYLGKLQAYTAKIQAETSRLTSESDVYQTQVQAYGSIVDAYSKEFQGGVQEFQGALSENQAETDSQLKQAEINITKAVEENKILIESIKAGAQVSADVASAALTAISLGASMSAQGTENTNHNYDYEV